jgi:hypothetical protein
VNRYFIKLSFDGTHYHGWQTQPNAITVQEVLNKAFSMLLRTPVKLTGCGRPIPVSMLQNTMPISIPGFPLTGSHWITLLSS